MKNHIIRFDRVVSEELVIPFDIVKSIDTYDSTLNVIHQDGSTMLVVPIRNLTFCAVMEKPDPKPAADHLTDEDLRAAEPAEA